MSLCNTCRSFAIYLVIVSLISESPVSGFAIRRVRTTTLRPLDLTGEESALLEVKSELSKLNNERENVKHGPDKLTIRKSVNFLTPDGRLGSDTRKAVITTTKSSSIEHDDSTKPSEEKSTRDTETTTGIGTADTRYTKKYRILKAKKAETFKTRANTLRKISEDNEKERTQDILSKNKTLEEIKIDKLGDFSTRVENIGTTTHVPDELQSTNSDTTTSDIPENSVSTTNINEKAKETTINEENTSDTTQVVQSSTQVDETLKTNTMGSTTLENTSTNATDQESMEGQSSTASTKNPSRRKYTVIERKRIISTKEPEIDTEVLQNAESVSSTLTLENAINLPPADVIKENQELISDLRTTVNKNQDYSTDVPLTTYETTKVLEPEIKEPLSTETLEKDTTTAESVGSKRAGYLDYSIKQTTANEEVSTTENLNDLAVFNETELLGSILEIDTQDDGPDHKNSTMIESQSLLAEDAVNEELLKEEVLSDHAENSKRLEAQQELDKVKPLDSNDGADDSLSVKPIAHGKGALYTVSSNYKRMKKIEVQPSRPYVRDPDDNSWRNESLTSLGIVFKAKNASKPFTQVLKNKTEAELNSLVQTERENTNEVPDLRQRLEKIAEVRKSRKKKIDKFGEMVYSDYEEASGETSSTPKTDSVSVPIMEVEGEVFFLPLTTSSPTPQTTQRTTTPGVYMFKEETPTTKKPRKNKFHEYYDTTDEYDGDYLSLAKIDLKKFTTRLFANEEKATASTSTATTPILTPFTQQTKAPVLPERKPTLQYFPPREKPQKVNMNDYDSDFQRKVNMYEPEKLLKDSFPMTRGTPGTLPPATVIKERPIQYHKQNVIPQFPVYKAANLDKNVYVTFPPHAGEHAKYPGSNDESFNRASYVIKHYRDLINEAVKDDYDKSAEFMPVFTEAPLVGVTLAKEKASKHEDYDYDANFRKDILNRFVENFNQHSEQFKVDFPILYNNTVVHMKAQDDGKVVASSSAFMKRLYEGAGKPCDPHCDPKVELSPAYELHYYVPDQEEKEEAELRPATLPFSYRL